MYWPLGLIACCGLLLAGLTFNRLSFLEQKSFKQAFILDAQNRISAIERNVSNVINAVQVLGRLFDSSQSVERDEFKIFAGELLRINDGIQALEWIPRVSSEFRSTYEERARQEGLHDFGIVEQDSHGGIMPAKNYKEFFPIYYLEPSANAESLMGYDLSSEPSRAAALYQARDMDRMFISHHVKLPQEVPSNQYSFLVLKALYPKGASGDGVLWRRNNLQGFVGGLLRLSKITDQALSYVRGKEISIVIVDQFAASKDQLIYEHRAQSNVDIGRLVMEGHLQQFSQGVYYAQAVTVLNKQWVFFCIPSEAYLISGRSWVPLAGAGGVLLLTLVLFWYVLVTLRHSAKVEREVKVATENLLRVNGELERFAYTASHDMRAPLRGIASFASFLQNEYKDKLDAKGKEYVGEIILGVTRLRDLIDDLLSLSKASQEHPYEEVDIKEVLQDVGEKLKLDIREHKVNFFLNTDLPQIFGNRIKLQMIFLNLINNAIKFSVKNNPHQARVEIGFSEDETNYCFFVKDNGIGIKLQDQDKIFSMFHRLHRSSEYEGSGIGLGIVKKAVEDHGGKAWVVSHLGQGATFYFTIPKNLKDVR